VVNEGINVMQQPQQISELRSVHFSASDRIVALDPDSTLQQDLVDAWEVVGPDIDLSLSAAAAVLGSQPSIQALIQDGSSDALRAEGARRTRVKFQKTIDESWFDDIGGFADVCFRLKMPLHVAIAVIHAGYSVFVAIAMRKLEHDHPRMMKVVKTLGTLEAIETEAIFTKLNQLYGESETERRQRHGAEFEEKVMATVGKIAETSSNLRAQARNASTESVEMLDRSTEVASAAQQSTLAMQEAASLTGQLCSAIEHVKAEIERASRTASAAANQTEESQISALQLAESATQIETIIAFIRQIAGQTNLLALNATIEAARAGEAGRGFSVVASEVKSLSQQTSSATEDIARQIATAQSAIRKSVDATQAVGETITQIHQNATEVQSSVNQQLATVVAITTAVEETSLSAANVGSNMAAVRNYAERMSHDMAALDKSTEAVDDMLTTLRSDLSKFRSALIAA
jgi:methyl-accepting chemotaxis protein